MLKRVSKTGFRRWSKEIVFKAECRTARGRRREKVIYLIVNNVAGR